MEKNRGRPNYLSRGRYDGWTENDLLRNLKRVADQEGKKPTKSLLWERINERGLDEPSPTYYKRRFGSFRSALELIGYPNIHSWQRYDYINFGVKFVEANQENLPTASAIDYLSARKRGPSAAQVGKIFNGVNAFKQDVWQEHLESLKQKESHQQNQLQEIENGLSNKGLPSALFDNASTEDDLLRTYAKFEVLNQLLPDDYLTSKISIASEGNQTARITGFVGSVRKVNNSITAGDLESTALYLGVFDDIWPQETEFLEQLKVPDELLEHRRLALGKNFEIQSEIGATALAA